MSEAKPYLDALRQLLSERPEVVCVTCGEQALRAFEEHSQGVPSGLIALPNAPSAAVAFCAGLAREGLRPFLHAQASGLTRGAYEVILTQLAATCLPVRLIAFDGGLSHEGGVGAQAIDDLNLIGGLPQMSVVEPGDALELAACPALIDDLKGPVYTRVTLGPAPKLFESSGRPQPLDEPRALTTGAEVLLISAGRCTAEVMRAHEALESARVGVHHLHLQQLAPLPLTALKELIEGGQFKAVITLEEQLSPGLLARGLSRLLCGLGELNAPPPLIELSLHQSFAQGGSPAYLMRKYGIDAGAVLTALDRALKRRSGVSLSDLEGSGWM